MKAQDHPSAEKTLLARSADGEEWELQIKIWPPQQADIAPWGCEVEITKLFSPAKKIYGEDSWQAQALAMRFAATLVQDFVERGGVVFWPAGQEPGLREEFNVLDLLPAPKR